MTVNITINADTLELTNVDGMTRIVCNDTEKKDKPESENDWIVRRKLKPKRIMAIGRIDRGLYFRRETPQLPWIPWLFKDGESLGYSESTEILGPITPDMFL